MFQEQIGLLNADIVRMQHHVHETLRSGGPGGLVTTCLREVMSTSGDMQQRIRVFLVDFDLQFSLASTRRADNNRPRFLTRREHNDTI